MKLNKLTREEKKVILKKGTERPHTGKYTEHFENGLYVCRQCNAPLYESKAKFKSTCGWPSFDEEIPGAVKRVPDADGSRTEIVCSACGGHLGHVFEGEMETPKNVRHCVNSISMKFLESKNVGRAIFAGGCFWGVEYFFAKQDGVLKATSGFAGGTVEHPSYEQVSAHATDHVEAVEVLYDNTKTNYETLAKLFFEIHDPTQKNGQGPDIGDQYLSVIFYSNDEEKEVAKKLINTLKDKGMDIATKVQMLGQFWPAEEYHQKHYEKKGGTPYCHVYTKRF